MQVFREEPYCRKCKGAGFHKLSREIDHIIPLEEGGAPFERSNLQALCSECHGAKTAREVARRS